MRDIGKNIRDLRTRQNMTQDELADKIFVTRQTVSNYETGRSRPDVEMLTNIAEALNTDPNTLLYGPAPSPGRKSVLKQLVPPLLLLAAVTAGYGFLYEWFNYLASRYFQTIPRICLGVLGKPLIYLLLGWTAMQVLCVLRPVPPFSPKTAGRVKLGLFLTIGLYLLFTGSFLVFAPMLSISFPEFIWGWSQVFYFILGARAGQHSLHTYLICAFIIGVLFRLCNFPSRRKTTPEPPAE